MSLQLDIQESRPSSIRPIVEDGTFHEDFLAFMAAKLRVQSYLELGVGQNETLQKVRRVCNGRMVAVDIAAPMRRVPLVHYFIKPVEEFLKNDAEGYAPYDLVFIDADHRYESVKRDFNGVWPFVAEQGLVILHDVWPKDKASTDPGYCGDAWRFAVELQKKKYECVTIPYHPGIMIVRKAGKHLGW